MAEPRELLATTYGELSAVLSSLAIEEGWEPTGCAGWTPVDLGFHLLSDARRALVALATPADGPADTDAIDYWRAWHPLSRETTRSCGAPGSRRACTAG